MWTDTSGEQQYLVAMALPSRKSPKQVRIQQTIPIWGARRPGLQTWFNRSVQQGLPAGPSPPQRHLTLKLPTAGLIPLPPKVCHPLREQHQHSLISQPDTGQSSEVYISHTHHPTHPIHHHSPEPPPHSSSWSVLSFLSCPYHHLSLSDSATAMPDSNIHPLK